MQTPTARLLELLELLQARPLTTGREISTHLEIDARTVRRYVAALQDLGIPVEGQRGVGGGYRVRPGYRLPPLMLSGDEAVVVVLGLIAARRQGLASEAASVDGALEKLHRVLPDPLRRRVEALEATLGFTTAPRAGAPVASDAVLLLAEAVRRGLRVKIGYRAFDGARTRRELSPYGLVVHAGRWYLAAHDHLRDDLRTLRIDRMSALRTTREPRAAAPDGVRRGHLREPLARGSPVGLAGGGAPRPPASTAPPTASRAPWRSSTRRTGARGSACGSTRSTGWRASSQGSTAISRSARRRSYERASPALRNGSRCEAQTPAASANAAMLG